MKVYDVFTIMNEWDVLECRIHELQHEVDYFCAVFGNMTHQGAPLEVDILAFRKRFGWLGYRLREMMVDLDMPQEGERSFGDEPHWVRFHRQENGGAALLYDADDNDIVFFGDVDEIPRRGMSELRPEHDKLMALKMRHHVYSLDWVVDEAWIGTGVARVSFARKHGLHKVRVGRPIENLTVVPYAGWHLSWFGGIEACRKKVESFTHPELREFLPALPWAMKYGLTCDGRRMFRVSYDENNKQDWPFYVQGGDMGRHWLK